MEGGIMEGFDYIQAIGAELQKADQAGGRDVGTNRNIHRKDSQQNYKRSSTKTKPGCTLAYTMV